MLYFAPINRLIIKDMSQKMNENHLNGLTDQEVIASRQKYGENLLTPPKRPSIWKLYLEKFQDPVIRVLLVAAVFHLSYQL